MSTNAMTQFETYSVDVIVMSLTMFTVITNGIHYLIRRQVVAASFLYIEKYKGKARLLLRLWSAVLPLVSGLGLFLGGDVLAISAKLVALFAIYISAMAIFFRVSECRNRP